MGGRGIPAQSSIRNIDFLNSPTIIWEINNIEFTHLRELNLGGNGIESVEGFHRIRISQLKWLWLRTSTTMQTITT